MADSTRSVPLIATTPQPGRYGIRPRRWAPTYPANSAILLVAERNSQGRASQCRASRRNPAASYTPTTVDPACCSESVTGNRNGPGSGDDNPLADGDAFALGHGLRGAGGHHAGQRPARDGKSAIVRPGGQDQRPGGDRLAASAGPVDVAPHHVDAHPVVAALDRPDVGAYVERQGGVGADGRA